VHARIPDDLAYPSTSGRAIDVDATGGVEITPNQNVNVAQWDGSAVATPTVSGVPEVDITHFGGAAGTFASGRPETNTSHIGGTLQTAGDVIGDTNDIQARLPAALVSGKIDASVGAYAAGMTPTRASASGTADSGSTTTVVDTERTEADTDYWKGCLIKFTSGTLNGQTRLITAFDPATDTLTFAPALTVAADTHTYEIYAMGRADLHLWLGSLVNALISGRVDADSQVVGDKTGYALSSAGVQAIWDALTSALTTAGSIGKKLADWVLGSDAKVILSNNAHTGAVIPTVTDLTNAPTSGDLTATMKASVNAEVVDAVATDTIAELSQAAPAATPTMRTALMLLYMMARNKYESTATGEKFHNDAGGVFTKSTLSDNGTTFSREELVSGP